MAAAYVPPSPSAALFAEVLSEESEWYTLATFLDTPVQDLDDIQQNYSRAPLLRRYIEVHKCLERRGKCLSWEHIATCLRKTSNHQLAEKIHSLYIQPLLCKRTSPAVSNKEGNISITEPAATRAALLMPPVEDDKIDVIAQEFKTLRERFDRLITQRVKHAFRNSTASADDVREMIEDMCGRDQIILQSTDEKRRLDEVFVWVKDHYSFLRYGDLMYLVDYLPEKDLVLMNEVLSFTKAVESFKSSAKMTDFIDLIKSEQEIASDEKLVQLKVRELWSELTMKQFETVANEVLHINRMPQLIGVDKTCICVSWVVPDHVDTNMLVPELSLEIVKVIGIIYLYIGDKVIYNFEGEGCETIEAAMLQAIKLKNTRAIELLLAMGCSPEVATYNGDNAVTMIVNIRETSSASDSSVHHVCVLGHSEHVEAIVDPSSEPQCSSCGMKDTMIKQLLNNQKSAAVMEELVEKQLDEDEEVKSKESDSSKGEDAQYDYEELVEKLKERELQVKRLQFESRTKEAEYKKAEGLIFVIGISSAEGTAEDVDNIASTFKELNFAVFIERDSTAEQIACLIRVAAECNYPQQYRFIAFYFAGHGGKDASGKLFIQGLQGNESNPTIVHIEDYIIDPLSSLKRFHCLFFFDCRTSSNDIPYQYSNVDYTLKAQPQTLVAYSISSGQKSVGDWGNGSIWTSYLCHNLKRNLPITQVLAITSDEVMREMKDFQEPVTVHDREFRGIILKPKQSIKLTPSTLFKKHYGKLVKMIGSKYGTELWSAALWSVDLVSDDTNRSFMYPTSGQTLNQKASQLMDAVYKQLKVSNSPEYLETFCEVLESFDDYPEMDSIRMSLLEGLKDCCFESLEHN